MANSKATNGGVKNVVINQKIWHHTRIFQICKAIDGGHPREVIHHVEREEDNTDG